jgi:hypothetical protein
VPQTVAADWCHKRLQFILCSLCAVARWSPKVALRAYGYCQSRPNAHHHTLVYPMRQLPSLQNEQISCTVDVSYRLSNVAPTDSHIVGRLTLNIVTEENHYYCFVEGFRVSFSKQLKAFCPTSIRGLLCSHCMLTDNRC